MTDDPPGDPTVDPTRRKLVETKQRWAEEGRLLTGAAARRGRDRLPPGQHLVQNWPVLDLGVQPRVERWDWKLTVDGLVAKPVTWTYQDLLAQPQIRSVSDIHCVTAWSRYDNEWEGVAARHLLAVVQPAERARFLVFHSHDGYTTNLRREHFDDDDVLLATKWQGEPLSREHGGPVRAIVPKFYFWKSAKWIRRIEFVTADKPGFWENRGYHNEGDPWTEQRYG